MYKLLNVVIEEGNVYFKLMCAIQMATELLGHRYTVWGFNLVISATIGISFGPGAP